MGMIGEKNTSYKKAYEKGTITADKLIAPGECKRYSIRYSKALENPAIRISRAISDNATFRDISVRDATPEGFILLVYNSDTAPKPINIIWEAIEQQ